MANGCPVCGGVGRVLAFGACRDPIPVTCPECAGLQITPASADDHLIAYPAAEITRFLLGRWPALPAPSIQAVDQRAEPPVRSAIEVERDALHVERVVVGDLGVGGFASLDLSADEDVGELRA